MAIATASLLYKDENNEWVYFNLLDTYYPIGTIYYTLLEASPAELLGGVWASLNDNRFLKPASGTVSGLGGQQSYTIPNHLHWGSIGKYAGESSVYLCDAGSLAGQTSQVIRGGGAILSVAKLLYGQNSEMIRVNSTSPSGAHTIPTEPAYRNCHAWYRIS